MSSSKTLFLIDAYALIFRSYYAFINNPMRNSDGLNTSAIFGFTNTLLDVINKEKPSHIAVAFDYPAATFRHKIFPEYKANRQATPEDIKLSVPYIKEIIKALNIPILEKEGFEADDIVGTFAKIAEKKDFEVFMMTPDKDFGQLVSDNVFMYKPKRSGNSNEILGTAEINEKYSLTDPIQFIDILALMGDNADNIPGAPGIGEKTAIKLIREFYSLENLLDNINKLKGKQKENIENNIEQIKLSKILATIDTEVPIDFSEKDLKLKAFNNEKLKNIFEELNFKSLINKISLSNIKKPEQNFIQGSLFDTEVYNNSETIKYSNLSDINTSDAKYYLTDNVEDIKILCDKINTAKKVCFDTETTSLNVYDAKLVGISLSFKNNEAYYIPIYNNINKKEYLSLLKPILENKEILKIGQNLKYDIHILRNENIFVEGKYFDTMLAHYLVQPDLKHNLDFLAENYLNYKKITTESLIGKKGNNQLSMANIDVNSLYKYACEDADITFQLKEILEKELEETETLDIFNTIETPLLDVLVKMEQNGVKLNTDSLNIFSSELRNDLILLEKNIFNYAGMDFNISSPKQLGEILFDKLKIDSNAKKTKTKQYSTGEEILIHLKDKHPIINEILEYRGLKKLLNTYVDAIPKLVNNKTGKIHTSFNQAITSTGRLSSNNPNLQNIPIRESRGKEIRKSFIPSSKEHLLFSVDYSQIELRLIAHISKDENMIAAFNNNIDIHSTTAAKINKITIDKVTQELRSKAKTANFGIIYGISAFGLSQRLNIPRSEAKELIDSYFSSFPKIKSYMDNSIQQARDYGYVKTLFGRRRYLTDINSRNGLVRGNAERNAINAPIQGTAADIIKLAMISIHNKLIFNNFESKMILQVHDELIFDVLKTEFEDLKKLVVYEMEHIVSLSIPLTVDFGFGNTWFDAH